jgi:hypothetical protein
VIKIRYALASDIAAALGLGRQRRHLCRPKQLRGHFGFGGLGGSRNGLGGGGFGGQGGYGGQGRLRWRGRRFGGQGGSVFGQATGTSALGSGATGARSSFQNNLGRIVQNAAGAGQFQLFGQTKIIADERTNSLLVFANDEDMKMIKDIIDKLDVVLAQVLIDAIIMEINLGTESTGVSYLSQRQGGGTFTGAGGINNLSSAASGFLTGGYLLPPTALPQSAAPRWPIFPAGSVIFPNSATISTSSWKPSRATAASTSSPVRAFKPPTPCRPICSSATPCPT